MLQQCGKEILKTPSKKPTTGGCINKMPAKRFGHYQSFPWFKSNFFHAGHYQQQSCLKLAVLSCDRLLLQMELRFDPKLIIHYIGRHLLEPIRWAVLLKDRILCAFSFAAK